MKTAENGRKWSKVVHRGKRVENAISRYIRHSYTTHEYLTMNIDKKHTKMRDCTSIVLQVENIAPACNSI